MNDCGGIVLYKMGYCLCMRAERVAESVASFLFRDKDSIDWFSLSYYENCEIFFVI